jgi:hypothetical protein
LAKDLQAQMLLSKNPKYTMSDFFNSGRELLQNRNFSAVNSQKTAASSFHTTHYGGA